MKGIQKGICLLLVISVVLAQPLANGQQTDAVSDLWLNRARLLTDELVKDSDTLGRYDRAILFARLGKAWQQDNAEQSHLWIEKAVQSVEAAPDKEDATEYIKRLSTARTLLVLLGAQDKALSTRLNKIISATTETAAPNEDRENAKAKAEAALAVLDSNPQRAIQFALASLRAGGSYKLASLIWRLRKRDVNLSDGLFMEIIAAARARNYDPNLLTILPTVAFEGPVPSNKLRVSLLDVLAEGLLRIPKSTQEQSAICQLAYIAAPLLPEFQRLIPLQAGMVRAQLIGCKPDLDPDTRREISNALQEQPLKTVEDLLEAAGKTSDLEQRVTYRNRAAYMAFSEQKYDRAITILDGFSSEERELANKTMSGGWDSWRASFASSSAIAHLKRGDRYMMYQVIAATPQHLRALVQISVGVELAKKDGTAATQLLDEARAALAKTGSPQNFDSYGSLVLLYATLRPADALPVLRDGIKAINQTEQAEQTANSDAEAESQIALLSNDILMARYALPASLLALDDAGVRQTIALVASPTRRAAMRLKLLGASLAQRHAMTPERTTELKGRDNANQ